MLQRKQISRGAPPPRFVQDRGHFHLWKLEENEQEAGGFALFCFVSCGACVFLKLVNRQEKSGSVFSPKLNYFVKSPILPLLFVPGDQYTDPICS